MSSNVAIRCLYAFLLLHDAVADRPCLPYDRFDNPFPWSANVPLIVALDGSGNCTTIQGAIDLLNGKDAYRYPYTIYVKPGLYREKVRVPPLTPPLLLQGLGDGPEDVLVAWDDAEFPSTGPEGCRGNAGREWDSQTLQVAADDFTAADMTFWNSACGNTKGRNFAVAVTADRAAFFRVRILGGQDTFYTGFKRVYVRDSFINGTVDFIFGIGSAVFEGCEVQEASSGGYLTAHKGNNVSQVDGASAGCSLGLGASCEAYVFLDCRLTSTGAVDNGKKQTYLGRPWHGDWATVVFINSWLGGHIAAAGWYPWSTHCKDTDELCSHIFYGEVNSTGPGAQADARVRWSRQLEDDQVALYMPAQVLRGWTPAKPTQPPSQTRAPTPSGGCPLSAEESECGSATKGGVPCRWCYSSAFEIGICLEPDDDLDDCDGLVAKNAPEVEALLRQRQVVV